MLWIIICSSHACQQMFRANFGIVFSQIGLQVFADNISAATLGFYCKNCECFFANMSDDIGFPECINHVYIKPRTPRLNGKVERSHIIDDAKLFNKKLEEWGTYYNYCRPHAALDGKTPMKDSEKRLYFVCKRSFAVPQELD